MAWYRLAAQAWSFRSDSQREVLIRQIAAQLGELQGRWLHLRVTTRPYPVHMWAESFDHNALGRLPDVAGRARLGRVPRGRAAPPHGPVDVGQGGLPRHRGLRAQHARPLGGAGRAGARQGGARGRPGRARRAGRPRSGTSTRSSRAAASTPCRPAPTTSRGSCTARARSACPRRARCPWYRAGSPAGRPRTSRRSPTASRCTRSPTRRRCAWSGGCGSQTVLRNVAVLSRRADGGPAHPRGRRPVDAALRPAAVPGGVVGADLRPAARGGGRRAAAPDGQGAQPDPALHPRPRPRPADVAGPAGRPGAGGRGRAHQRAHPAQHPALRLVADRRVGQGRGGGDQPGPAGARRLPAEGADRAPRGAVPLRPRVHPRRAARVHGLPAARLGHLGGVRRAGRHRVASATGAAS